MEVYVSTANSMSWSDKRIHLEHDCRHLDRAGDVQAVDREALPADADVCAACDGTATEVGPDDPLGTRQLLLQTDPDATTGGDV